MKLLPQDLPSSLRLVLLGAVALSAGLAAVACDNPDPQGRYDEFVDGTSDKRVGGDDNSSANNAQGSRVDFSGSYLLAISPAFQPDKTLLFGTTVTVDTTANTVDISFQPLKTDTEVGTTDPRPDARAPVGEALVASDIPFEEDGTFELELTDAMVAGEANPISGSPITATLILRGTVTAEDAFCGRVAGGVTAPAMLPLDGSTFGAVAAEDFAGVTPAVKCEAGVNNTDNNVNNPDNNVNNPDNNVNNPDNNVNNDNNVEPTPQVRCVADLLAGTYDVQFITETQRGQGAPATEVAMTLEANEDAAICYTGTLVSKTTGDTLGTISSVTEIDGALTLKTDFNIPPGANPLLPDGGRAEITLPAASWSKDGMCGAMAFNLVEPFALPNTGDFSAVRQGAAGLSLTGPGCVGIERTEPCGYEDLAGDYEIFFETLSGGSNLTLTLEPDALQCLGGELGSKTTEGLVLARVTGASLDEAEGNTGGAFILLRNFVIPPGANPLLPDGGIADMELRSDQVLEDGFCGRILVGLFSPFALPSNGTFRVVPRGMTADPMCPE
jgi:hypothetical protein